MTVVQWGYTFDGPYKSPDNLLPEPGVFVIWHKINNTWVVLEVGECGNVKKRCIDPNRIDYLKSITDIENIYYGAHYMYNSTERDRKIIALNICKRSFPKITNT